MTTVHEMLLAHARERLPENLRSLQSQGDALDDHVFVVFNAALEPGTGFAISKLSQTNGLTIDEATVEARRRIAQAAKERTLLPVDGMWDRRVFAENAIGAPRLVAFLSAPVPPRCFRVVTINGLENGCHHVEISALSASRLPN